MQFPAGYLSSSRMNT